MTESVYEYKHEKRPVTCLWQMSLLGMLGHYDEATEENYRDLAAYHRAQHVQAFGPNEDDVLWYSWMADITERSMRVQFGKQIREASSKLGIEPKTQANLIEVTGSSYSKRSESTDDGDSR